MEKKSYLMGTRKILKSENPEDLEGRDQHHLIQQSAITALSVFLPEEGWETLDRHKSPSHYWLPHCIWLARIHTGVGCCYCWCLLLVLVVAVVVAVAVLPAVT